MGHHGSETRTFPDAFYERLWEDARFTYDVWQALTKKLSQEKDADFLSLYTNIELPLVRVVLGMEEAGRTGRSKSSIRHSWRPVAGIEALGERDYRPHRGVGQSQQPFLSSGDSLRMFRGNFVRSVLTTMRWKSLHTSILPCP